MRKWWAGVRAKWVYFLAVGTLWLIWQVFTGDLVRIIDSAFPNGGLIVSVLSHPELIMPLVLIILALAIFVRSVRQSEVAPGPSQSSTCWTSSERRELKALLKRFRQLAYQMNERHEHLVRQACGYGLEYYERTFFTDSQWFEETRTRFDNRTTAVLYRIGKLRENPVLADLKEKDTRWNDLLASIEGVVPKLPEEIETAFAKYRRGIAFAGDVRVWKHLYGISNTTISARDLVEDNVLTLAENHGPQLYRQLLQVVAGVATEVAAEDKAAGRERVARTVGRS